MKELYRPDLKAHVLTDAGDRVRSIRHSQEYWESPTGGGLMTAVAYLREMASVYEITASKFDRLTTKVSFLDPREQPEEYRLSEEKRQFDSETFGFYQTYLNVPVWKAGMKVTVKQGPNRVVLSQDTSQEGVNAKMPQQEVIDRYRRIFASVNSATLQRRALQASPDLRDAATVLNIKSGENDTGADREGKSLLRDVFEMENTNEATQDATRLIRGRFWIYRYDAANRFPDGGKQDDPVIKEHDDDKDHALHRGDGESQHHGLPHPFKIPPVPTRIQDGAFYMVAEITFEVSHGNDHHVWRALIELETNAVLYLKPMVGHVNGYVHATDPITKTGTTTPSSGATNAVLNPHRDNPVLQNLNAPVGTTQHLSGSFVRVRQIEGADITAPTVSVGSHFHYDTRTNNFASVSGYFHGDRIFRTMQDLGFNVATYMSNTVFPVPIDIRCFDDVNAHCVGDGMGGIHHAGYGLMDSSLGGEPLGRACDPRVHLHEVLGHGILYEAVDDANMRFVHSAGDSLSLIYFDPESNCKGVDGAAVGKPGDLRFTYVPWHPSLNRRCDRSVAAGWAWNGSRDDAGYGSEEILATTLFNFYRSIGGDHPSLGRRKFASRMSMYLIMRAIGDLTPATDPAQARHFADALMATDTLNWTSEGVYGGAYHKVIRWAFERQGEYQSPLVVNGGAGDGSVTSAGKPPPVDVYINDGRNGEYPFQHVHWHTTTVWNRRAPDGLTTHQEPELGSTNYAYVKVKNRGTQQATNVVVRAFHTKPGAGLNWPADFEPLATASINVGTINANNSEEKLVGPFEWTPNINTYGHDCMLMVASASGDASNVDNFTAGETIPEWRLVPNDNNIAQRNVNPVPAGGGEKGLMAGLNGMSFFVGNPDPKRGKMTFNIILPSLLVKLGWRLELVGVGDGFVLASGAKREVFMKLHAGKDFTRAEVEALEERDIRIDVLSNDNLIGGMTYRLDPDLTKPHNTDRPTGSDCIKGAQQLADCLGLKQDIDKICVKEIVVSLKMKNDGCC